MWIHCNIDKSHTPPAVLHGQTTWQKDWIFVPLIIRHLCQSNHVDWPAVQTELCKQFVLGPKKKMTRLFTNKRYNITYADVCEFSTLLLSFTLSNSWFTLLSPRPNEAAIKSLWNDWWNASSVLLVMWPNEGNSSPPLDSMCGKRESRHCEGYVCRQL